MNNPRIAHRGLLGLGPDHVALLFRGSDIIILLRSILITNYGKLKLKNVFGSFISPSVSWPTSFYFSYCSLLVY